MDTKVLIALLLVIGLVVIINGALVLMMRRGRDLEHIEMWKRAAHRARNPWKEEDQALQELSRLVAQFKEKEEGGENEA